MQRFLLLSILCFSQITFGQDINYAAVSNKVIEEIEKTPLAHHPILILLEDRIDFVSIVDNFEKNNIPLDNRPAVVMSKLKNKAANSQIDLLDVLHNSTDVLTETIKPFWVTNVIYAKAKKEIIAELSHRNDVEWIGLSGKLEMETLESSPAPPVIPDGIEAGLEVVGAPFMWDMGYTGCLLYTSPSPRDS